jgi:hypothetical protein
MMSLVAANGVMPPAMLNACMMFTLGLTMNSPGLLTCPSTKILLPRISCTEIVTTASEM